MKFVNCQPEVPSLVHEIGVVYERPGTQVAYSICFVDRAANEASFSLIRSTILPLASASGSD